MKTYINKFESELVELLKHSDEEAFNSLFRLYGSKVYHFAYGYLKSREEAEEILQDTFVRIWEKRTTIDASLSFSGFLFTVAHHMILNRIRKLKNENVCKTAVFNSASESSNETEEVIIHADLEKFRQQALVELPPRRKVIYQMIREQGMTYKQVAEKLEISVKTVESQMTEAIKHLRAKLSL